jgi:uncharacterized protein (TIGR03435 family)
MCLERQHMSRFLAGVLFISAAAAQPVFDVASIRSSQIGKGGEGSRRENIQASPGSLNMRNVSLKSSIRWAYHVMEYQVTGPDWLGFERYDIVAKANGPASEDQLRLMLQALLAERFKLTLHRETKDLQAYVMVVAKSGIKFHESQDSGEPAIERDKSMTAVHFKRVPASQVVDMLSNILHAPVINNTGFTGYYDATIDVAKYMQDHPASDSPADIMPILINGLQEELGLKLESKKMPLDLLIIDHAEKVPVEN